MSKELGKQRIETQALVVGYAMSRLTDYVSRRGYDSWEAAYKEASNVLDVKASSFKRLRDEFDPYNDNERRGYWQRPPRPSRQRILDELSGMSELAVYELVRRILGRDQDNINEALDFLATTNRVPMNVAERLLTGRRAEEYFLANSFNIARIRSTQILDRRNDAVGFDFGVVSRQDLAIEVKGMKESTGALLFTDKEWQVAHHCKENYWLVVVGNLASVPIAKLYKNPCSQFLAKCHYQESVCATWRFRVSLLSET